MNDERKLELELYLDGELPEKDRVRVARELVTDVEGKRYLDQLHRLHSLARRPATESASPKSLLLVLPQRHGLQRRHWVAAAMVAVALLGSGWWLGQRGSSPEASPPARDLVGKASGERIAAQEGESSRRRQPRNKLGKSGHGRGYLVAYSPRGGPRRGSVEAEWMALKLEGVFPEADAGPGQPVERPAPRRQPTETGPVTGRPGPADPLLEAKIAMTREDWDVAATALRALLEKPSTNVQASEIRFWLGYCLVKDEEYSEAVEILRPFQDKLAGEKRADDALLQLGHAHQGAQQFPEAIAAWKQLLEKHRDSVWRQEALLNLVSVLCYEMKDFAACFSYCELLMKASSRPEAVWDARHVGAYCLTALKRFEEGDRWMERWFHPTTPVEEAWRMLIRAQRDLVAGRAEAGLKTLAAMRRDFPDLDHTDWLDLTLHESFMLRQNGQTARAHALLLDLLPRLADEPSEEINRALDEFHVVVGADRTQAFVDELARLASDPKTPAVLAVTLWERQVAELRAADKPRQAVSLLRDLLGREKAEFARCRMTLLLADTYADDLETPALGIKLLEELLPELKRQDFVREARKKLEEYRTLQRDDK